MATFYALPGLVFWSQAGGWSSTSGGASNGIAAPGTADDVIFDANSGSARIISLNMGVSCNTVKCTGAPMSLSNVGNTGAGLNIYSTNIDLSGFSSIITGSMYVGPNNGTSPTVSIKTGACVVTINSSYFDAAGSALSLTGDLNINGPLNLTGPGMNANGYNVSCAYCGDGGTGTGTLVCGSGTWTFLGAAQSSLSLSGMALSAINTTFKFVGSAMSCNFTQISGMSNCTLWAASGTVSFNGSVGGIKFRMDAGATVTGGGAISATTWQVSGSATSQAIITNTRLVGNGAGTTVYLNYCRLTSCTGSNGTFLARSSTDGGSNVGITFYKLRPNFFSYF